MGLYAVFFNFLFCIFGYSTDFSRLQYFIVACFTPCFPSAVLLFLAVKQIHRIHRGSIFPISFLIGIVFTKAPNESVKSK